MDWHFLCGALYEKHPILGSQRRSRGRAPAPLRNTIFCRPEVHKEHGGVTREGGSGMTREFWMRGRFHAGSGVS